MSYISGARSVPDEQVRIASTKMDGIGPQKAIQLRYRLGISGNIKMNELTHARHFTSTPLSSSPVHEDVFMNALEALSQLQQHWERSDSGVGASGYRGEYFR